MRKFIPPLKTHKQQPQRVDGSVRGVDAGPALLLAWSKCSISTSNYYYFYQNLVYNYCASNIIEIKRDLLRALICPSQAGLGVAETWLDIHRPLSESSLNSMAKARVPEKSRGGLSAGRPRLQESWEMGGYRGGQASCTQGCLLPFTTAHPAQVPGMGVWALPQARLTENETISREPGPPRGRKAEALSLQPGQERRSPGVQHLHQRSGLQDAGSVLCLVQVLLFKGVITL